MINFGDLATTDLASNMGEKTIKVRLLLIIDTSVQKSIPKSLFPLKKLDFHT